MAYLQARANIARAGVTYAGWAPPTAKVYVNGVDRTANLEYEGFTITDYVDGAPSTANLVFKGFTPTLWHDIKILYATPDEYLFGGTLLQMSAVPYATASGKVVWRCTAVGYHWLLDRYDRIYASYASVGVGTMVGDILNRFTNGGFQVGYIEPGLGNLTMDFTAEVVSQALDRIAKAKDAFWELTPEKYVNVFITPPEAAQPTLTGSNVLLSSAQYGEEGTQVRTRELYEGQGSAATSPVSSGASVLPLESTTPFLDAGGTAVSGRNVITYTGRSTASGAGSLTGCSGIVYDIAQGDAVNLRVDVIDSAAQTALATALGGGLSGQVTHYVQDGRVSANEAGERAAADVAAFGTGLKEFTYHYVQEPRWIRVGRLVTASITTPFAISGTFRVQTLTTTWKGQAITGTSFPVWRQVTASPFRRSLADLLKQLDG